MTIAYDYTDYGMEYYSVAGETVEGVISRLGLAPNPGAQEFTEGPVVAEENLGLLDGDVLVVFYETHAVREEREGPGLFQAVPPVSGGRSVSVVAEDADSGAEASWVLRRGAGAVSLPWTVDQIAEKWLSDLDFS